METVRRLFSTREYTTIMGILGQGTQPPFNAITRQGGLYDAEVSIRLHNTIPSETPLGVYPESYMRASEIAQPTNAWTNVQ